MKPKSKDTDSLITKQMLVGFTEAQETALSMIATSIGMKASQYVRQLAVERLVQMKMIESPMARFQKATNNQSAET
jgi:hypothetical protein